MKKLLVVTLLLMGIAASAIQVSTLSHETRNLYDRLHSLEALKNELIVQRGQLLIERSSLTTPARVEQRATEELGMRVPEVEEIKVVKGD